MLKSKRREFRVDDSSKRQQSKLKCKYLIKTKTKNKKKSKDVQLFLNFLPQFSHCFATNKMI